MATYRFRVMTNLIQPITKRLYDFRYFLKYGLK